MRYIRISLVMVTFVLIAIGVVMIYSASSIYAWERLGSSAYFLKRHLMYLILGLLVTLLSMSIDYRSLKNFVKPILLISFTLLVLVILPGIGSEIAGARRWFRLFGFSFQPSEFAKIAIIVYIADYLSRKEDIIKDFIRGFVPAMIVLGTFTLLILLQPDLGTAVSIVAVVILMLFVAGTRLLHLGLVILFAIPTFYVLILSAPYRMARIVAFLNPWADPKGSGFQIIQSQIAIGSGGILGRGLGRGLQKLFYLPAAHTDFIFSIIAEELGLLGALSVVALFIIFIWQSARICKNAVDSFGYYLSLGIFSMISFEVIVNIGVSLGNLPTKGLPLPFISYGGSSLVFNMLSLGLLLNIARTKEI
ncbi:MAG: putative lipid II flippase FtsW [Candidatus Omnitrophota bacterium]|nr:putative lipid II flippase FtsW [Candidatus Omnitrophota bacterium]